MNQLKHQVLDQWVQKDLNSNRSAEASKMDNRGAPLALATARDHVPCVSTTHEPFRLLVSQNSPIIERCH
jgi:hypothetical protein